MTNINFASLDGTAVEGKDGQRQHLEFEMDFEFVPLDTELLVTQDIVRVNGRDLYYNQQRPDYVPYPRGIEVEGDTEINPGYIDKTNQQLWDQFGKALGGELMPEDAVSDPTLKGGKFAASGSADPTPTAEPGDPDPTETPIPQPTATPEPDDDDEDGDDGDDGDDSDGEEPGENRIYLPFITIGSSAIGGVALLGSIWLAFNRPQE